MKLFDVVPGNFFSVLSSGNRVIYYDALMILHDMFRYELNIRLNDYLASLISILEDRAFELEEGDEPEGNLTLSGRARIILNRLIKTGWVDREYLDNSFVEIITPRNYAIPVLKLLSEMSDSSLQEYNSLVFATYSGLKQAMSENESQLYEAVVSARANTEQLQYSLRTLYHGIRGFLRGIVDQRDVNTLLQDHFNEYKRMSDSIYHPIKTMDSVHRYMAPIQGILSDILAREDLLQSMRERAMDIRKYPDESLADEEIMKSIDFVLDSYQTVGGLVSEIDRKHSNYTKSSIEKIQYLMATDQSVMGNLTEILKAYAGLSESARDRLTERLQAHIQIDRQEFFDDRSLYHRSVRSRSDQLPLSVERGENLTDRLSQEFLLHQIQNAFPPSRIRAYIEQLFANGGDVIEAQNIPITCDADFILLMLAVIRHSERDMPFTVDLRTGYIENSGYRIPDIVIRRKGVRSHVE